METYMREKFTNLKKMDQANIDIKMEISLEDIGSLIKNKEKANIGARVE